MNLTSTSTGTHEFAATSGGTAVTSVTLPANTSSVTAYYGDEQAGTPTITAVDGTFSGTSTVTITAKTTGDTLSLVSGSGQSTTVGSAFTNPLVVQDLDQYGNPVSGVTVTFTPPASGASGTFTTSATAVTGSNGQATSNTYTANTTPGGPYNVVASATGRQLGELLRDQPRRCGPHRHRDLGQRPERDGGHGLHQQAGGHGHRPVRQPGLGRHGHLHAAGQRRLGHLHHLGHRGDQCQRCRPPRTPTRPTRPRGTYNVVASATGASSANFSETNTAKTTGDTLSLVSGSGQSATVGTAFSNPLVVQDVDQYGNPVSGVTVTFTPPASGASGTFTTSATAVTGSNGQATSNAFTANTTAGGPYNVVASATGATPTISFSMTNTAGAAHTVTATSGNGQSATVATAFTNKLVATVTDQYGNPVSGVTVTFTPPASGASGTFTTSATAVTGSNGQATSNTYTANTTAGGPYNVVASATGASLGFVPRDQRRRCGPHPHRHLGQRPERDGGRRPSPTRWWPRSPTSTATRSRA